MVDVSQELYARKDVEDTDGESTVDTGKARSVDEREGADLSFNVAKEYEAGSEKTPYV
jgi:hypothetical protein